MLYKGALKIYSEWDAVARASNLFTLHCSSSLSCMSDYLALDHGRSYYDSFFKLSVCINCCMLDAFQINQDVVRLN